MAAIIVAVVFVFAIVIVALALLGSALHFLLSPWLLLAIVAVVALLKLRPRRSHQ